MLPRKQWVLAFIAYFALASLLTWPLASQFTTHLPIGTESAATVPLFNLWTLLWNADRLAHGYAIYWNAPIFYPTPGTFALSEPQPLTGLIFSLVAALTRNPVTAYNLIVLLMLTLNGLSAFYLARVLDVRAGPAMLTGALAELFPFVFNELGVLQLLALFPIFFSLANLKLFSDQPSFRSALGLGAGISATFLTCEYYGLFLVVFLVWGGLCLVRRRPGHWKPMLHLAVGVGLAGASVLPVLLAQTAITSQYKRSADTIRANSAEPVDYLKLDERAWGPGLGWLGQSGGSGQRLYPGTILLGLAGLGIVAGWRLGYRRWIIYCAGSVVLAVLLSFGLKLNVGGFEPYQWLRDFVPGFGQLRSPFRFAVFAQVFLVMLAGLGLQWLWRPAWWGRGLAVALVGVGLIEVAMLPARLYLYPVEDVQAAWVDWLAEQLPGVVAMIPFPASGRARDYEATTVAMLQGLAHGHPLVNGYSGFFPASYDRLESAMRKFPSAGALDRLRESGVSYVVVETGWLGEGEAAQLEAADWRRAYRDETMEIYTPGGP